MGRTLACHTQVFEGMALFRLANGTFYIITSHLTGWNPNPLMLFRAALGQARSTHAIRTLGNNLTQNAMKYTLNVFVLRPPPFLAVGATAGAAGKTLDDPQWVSMGNPTGSSTSPNLGENTPHNTVTGELCKTIVNRVLKENQAGC